MNTASTSGQAHSSAVEVKACSTPNSRADSQARSRSRRESAVTRQLRAFANPGIKRFTACSPNPAIPNRIIPTPFRYRSYATLVSFKDTVDYDERAPGTLCRQLHTQPFAHCFSTAQQDALRHCSMLARLMQRTQDSSAILTLFSAERCTTRWFSVR